MAMSNSANQHWASPNKHFLSNTSLFVIIFAKTFLYVGEI